ncbi:MAG: hypothetical protein PHR87_08995 [Sulfurospirillaceae bacterium]|nr:hypothetical protein [Sulfurospirillaceae bacterium]
MNSLNTPLCIYCSSKKLYHVSPTQYRCALCKRTFSIKKQAQNNAILEAFIANESVHACSQALQINYLTVKKAYQKIRLGILDFIEQSYTHQKNAFSQYDEYYFLPHTKKGNLDYFFDSIGILGMAYEHKIYTLLLPDQFSHLKHLSKDLIDMHYYAHYLHNHKMAHFESFNTIIHQFWRFLENFMRHFKGVQKENFIYYLKEAEFKFNYEKDEQRTILKTLFT